MENVFGDLDGVSYIFPQHFDQQYNPRLICFHLTTEFDDG